MDILALSDGASVFGFVVVPFVLAMAFARAIRRSQRKKTLIVEWVERSGIKLLECEERSLLRGPFFLSTGKSRVVYRIAVEYPDGRYARGWLRFGGPLSGLWSDECQVRWDEQKHEPDRPGFPVILKGDSSTPPGDIR